MKCVRKLGFARGLVVLTTLAVVSGPIGLIPTLLPASAQDGEATALKSGVEGDNFDLKRPSAKTFTSM